MARKNIPPMKQVKLRLVQIDVWSAIKIGFLVSIALGIATMAGFTFLWMVVNSSGLFGSLSSLLNSVLGSSGGLDIGSEVTLPRVLSFAGVLSIVNVILVTLLSAIVAIIFNVIAKVTGGLSVGFTNE